VTDPEPLTPRPNQPDHKHAHRIVMTVGGRRFELMHYIESREITRGPAEVIEMPRAKAEIPESST
jgi:hypothetical protein